jgi:hypothetical protein
MKCHFLLPLVLAWEQARSLNLVRELQMDATGPSRPFTICIQRLVPRNTRRVCLYGRLTETGGTDVANMKGLHLSQRPLPAVLAGKKFGKEAVTRFNECRKSTDPLLLSHILS